MATYTYASYAVYADGAQTLAIVGPVSDRDRIGVQNGTGSVSDMEADSTFELTPPPDTVTLDVNPDGFGNQTIVVTYEGQVTIDGTAVPVFSGSGTFGGAPFNFFVAAAPVPQVPGGFTYPASLPTETASAFTVCFGRDTMIATPEGETKVQELAIGDVIRAADGRDVQVKWLGRQTVLTGFASARQQPVRIRAGALGAGLPMRDLVVTADHGMVLDGHVINASALVNGDSIDWVPLAELGAAFTVYHVETEAHDVILANGSASETFVDAATRQNFDNYPEYLDLYGAERIIPEAKLPRISSARLVPEHLRRRLGRDTRQDAAQVA